MKEEKVWIRPFVSRSVDLDEISEILQDIHLYSGVVTESMEIKCADAHADLDNYVRVLKYKTVDKKVRPVPAVMPEDVKVERSFPDNPLSSLPVLPTHAPEFSPTE